MKIEFKGEGRKHKISLPTKLICSKLVLKHLKIDSKAKDKLLKIRKKTYKTFKKYIKENGHFYLVEMESNGSYLRIRL